MKALQKDNIERISIYTNYGYLNANKKEYDDKENEMISIKSENGTFTGTINVKD
jgi:hypothetical protein